MTPFEKAVEAMFHAENGIDGDSVGDMVFEDFRISGTAEEAIKTSKAVLARALTAALSALESEGWGAALIDACQLLDSVKMDWSKSGEWSAWDQSVRDRLSAMNVELYRAMLASRPAPTAPASEG